MKHTAENDTAFEPIAHGIFSWIILPKKYLEFDFPIDVKVSCLNCVFPSRLNKKDQPSNMVCF